VEPAAAPGSGDEELCTVIRRGGFAGTNPFAVEARGLRPEYMWGVTKANAVTVC